MNGRIIQRNRKYYEKRIAFILEEIRDPILSILDLGCGEMILRDCISKLQCKEYLGVDELTFSNKYEFIQADVFSFLMKEYRQWDYVFCLGLIDHLSKEQGKFVVNRATEISKVCTIISLANSANLFLKLLNLFVKKDSMHFIKSNIKIYLLKIPFTQVLFKISSNRILQKYLATEIIYISTK